MYTRCLEDLFWWIATSGKVARHFGWSKSRSRSGDQGDLKTASLYALHNCTLTLQQQHHTSPIWAHYSVYLCWPFPVSVP
jgi:hypothetical protein